MHNGLCRTPLPSRLEMTMVMVLCGRVQAHMGRLDLPITDYVGDTKSALDNSVRILQAITDVAADAGWLRTALATMRVIQGLMQVHVRLSATTGCGCIQCFDALNLLADCTKSRHLSDLCKSLLSRP